MEKILVAILPFERWDGAALEDAALKVRSANAPRRSGKSSERLKAHHAGRVAAAYLFQQLGLDAKVGVNRAFGYLTLVDAKEKPMKGFFLNISHTLQYAAAVLAPHPVGIDLESKTRSAERVLQRVASETERQEALAHPPCVGRSGTCLPAGIALWSAKEAACKAIGLGMKFGLARFQVSFAAGPPYSVQLGGKGPLKVEQPALWFLEYQQLLISLCTEARAFRTPPECLEVPLLP